MGLKIKALLTVMIMLVLSLPMSVKASEQPRLLIVEIKLGGDVTNQPTEFVKIFNDSNTSVDGSNLILEYAKATSIITNCEADWKTQDSVNVRSLTISGEIPSKSLLTIDLSMTDNKGGSLRLRDNTTVYDLVGWGKEDSLSKCSEKDPAPVPVNSKSLRRYVSAENIFVDSDNNAEDFLNNQNPIGDPFPLKPADHICSGQNCLPLQQSATDCSMIELSEIVPNPSGIDTNNEYVELHNPTIQNINLNGCSLSVGSTTKNLDGEILPGYKAFYGLTLPNAAGGTVQFMSPTTEESVTYPGDLGDDEAWALINGTWQITNLPTPNDSNIASKAVVATVSTSTLVSCPEGKYRNPETNRCKSYATSNFQPCSPGQVRNPETNRCRKLTATALTSLKPCSPGQVRNPSTNRCKKNAESTLVACKEGQERNPDTNRCRKVAGTTTSTPSTGNSKPQQVSKLNYGLFALLVAAAGGYGIYEYRGEIGVFISRLKTALKK